MPFVQEDGSAEATGRAGSGLPPATLVVHPDKILFVKRGFEDEVEAIRSFIYEKGHLLTDVPPPGADPCSEGVVEALSQNGQSALEAAWGYIAELTNVINALDEIARAYGMLEETSTDRFGQEPG